jgi:1-acyl-sn-glycerol-3-phosphate acyltransferase
MRPILMIIRAALYFFNFLVLLVLVPVIWVPLGAGRCEMKTLVKIAARNTFRIFGVSWSIQGAESLDPDQNYIFIANHRSWLDQAVMILAAPQLLSFLGKEAYFKIPILRTTLRLFRCIPVPREAGNLIEKLAERLGAGDSLVIYPEGTRSVDDEFLQFKSGAFVLSEKTGTPIVPIYIYGAKEILPRAQPFTKVKPGALQAVVGEPFVIREDVTPALLERVRAEYIEHYEELRPQAFEGRISTIMGRNLDAQMETKASSI